MPNQASEILSNAILHSCVAYLLGEPYVRDPRQAIPMACPNHTGALDGEGQICLYHGWDVATLTPDPKHALP